MPSGGSREGSGRKTKWEEPPMIISVPSSIGNDVVRILEEHWSNGLRGRNLIKILELSGRQNVKMYENTVSASPNTTSTLDNTSINANYEEIDLIEILIPNAESTIVIPVSGDSMTGIGIYPGDWLIVEQVGQSGIQPKEGDIIVVSINDETMVKRYCRDKDEILLLSENEKYGLIRCSEQYPGSEIYVTGIVKTAIRRNL